MDNAQITIDYLRDELLIAEEHGDTELCNALQLVISYLEDVNP